jgi:hypothetical protein
MRDVTKTPMRRAIEERRKNGICTVTVGEPEVS